MKQFTFYFNDCKTRVIIAKDFLTAFGALAQDEKVSVRTVCSTDDVTVIA